MPLLIIIKDLRFLRNLREMVSLAEKLSKEIPFVRVDFYDIDQHIYFGRNDILPSWWNGYVYIRRLGHKDR